MPAKSPEALNVTPEQTVELIVQLGLYYQAMAEIIGVVREVDPDFSFAADPETVSRQDEIVKWAERVLANDEIWGFTPEQKAQLQPLAATFLDYNDHLVSLAEQKELLHKIIQLLDSEKNQAFMLLIVRQCQDLDLPVDSISDLETLFWALPDGELSDDQAFVYDCAREMCDRLSR